MFHFDTFHNFNLFFYFSQFCHQKCECCFSEKMKIEIRFYSKFSQIFSLLSLFWLTKFDRIFFKWFQFVRNNVWSSVLILIVEFDFWKWTRCWNTQCTSFCMSIFNLTNCRLNPHRFVVMSSRENSIDRNLNLIFYKWIRIIMIQIQMISKLKLWIYYFYDAKVQIPWFPFELQSF